MTGERGGDARRALPHVQEQDDNRARRSGRASRRAELSAYAARLPRKNQKKTILVRRECCPFYLTDNFPHYITRGGGNPQTPMAMLRPRARGVFGGATSTYARTHTDTFTH